MRALHGACGAILTLKLLWAFACVNKKLLPKGMVLRETAHAGSKGWENFAMVVAVVGNPKGICFFKAFISMSSACFVQMPTTGKF